jgi:hypothetical protein
MLRRAWLATGLVGVLLLVPFDAPVTLALGILCLFGFVGLGLAVIASPAFTRDDERSQPPRR